MDFQSKPFQIVSRDCETLELITYLLLKAFFATSKRDKVIQYEFLEA